MSELIDVTMVTVQLAVAATFPWLSLCQSEIFKLCLMLTSTVALI